MPNLSVVGRIRSKPLLALILLVWGAAFATRPTALPLRGEETRRARIAYEMIESGDYFVSRVQGVPEMGRPPLAEWAIAGTTLIFGEMTPITIRLPAVTATLTTALLLYFYGRRFCSAYGAAAMALIYMTFGHVLQMGRIAETDALFTAVTAVAVLGWHHGYACGRPPWQVWMWGYGWAALAVLTKSPQAIVYFVAIAGAYLLVRRDWRFLFAPGHAAGWLAYTAVFGIWFVPYVLNTEIEVVRENLFGQIAGRVGTDKFDYGHLMRFPWQIVGALLPWSLLLVRYADRRFLRDLGSARDATLFCGLAVAVTFPTVWFSWPAGPRHLMSMYPCFAVLAGVVVERALTAERTTSLAGGWRLFVAFLAVSAIVTAVGLGLAPLLDFAWTRVLVQPLSFAMFYAAAAMATAVILVRSLRDAGEPEQTAQRRFLGFAAAAVLLGISYAGVAVNVQVRLSEDQARAMAELKKNLPISEPLVSFGPLDNSFVYHYRNPIPLRPWPTTEADRPAIGAYFSFDPVLSPEQRPSFAWEQVAVFSCDRNHHEVPQRPVIIGRRIADPVVTAEQIDAAVRR